MFCKNCGKELPDNTEFCTGCGANQDVQQEVPVQTTVNPGFQSNGYPVNQVTMPKNNSNKKNKLVGKIAVLAVVVLVVGIILVVNIVSSHSGAKGAVNRYIDAVNDYDIEKMVDCSPFSLFLDEDDFEDLLDALGEYEDKFDVVKDADVEFDVEFKSEKDITDDDCYYDEDQTWKEFYQEFFEEADNYDDQEVQAVKEVRVNLTYDYDEDYEDEVKDTLDGIEDMDKFTCIKIDGDWYVYYI